MLVQLLRFRECEHQGDQNTYAREVSRCAVMLLVGNWIHTLKWVSDRNLSKRGGL